MRIQTLNLAAFGPFTHQRLDFQRQTPDPDFHIVYGPNEAGKSSALRGLKALLYGIDAQTPDNFIHPYGKLRIEGCLQASDGQKLAFARRKGQKNTLLSFDQDVLDESSLQAFLHHLPRTLFDTLFGIDHPALIQGGQAILQQQGDVGQTLFSAALGSQTLHTLLTELDAEANELFLPRGSKQRINRAVKDYTELNRRIKEQALSPQDWQTCHQKLTETQQALEQIQDALGDSRSELNRLLRLQRTLPKLARRRELLQALNNMGETIRLPKTFTERRLQTVQALETARALIQTGHTRLENLQARLDALTLRADILQQSDTIDALYKQLGSHQKARLDQPHLDAERQQHLNDAQALLQTFRPGLTLTEAETLRGVLVRKPRIQELGQQQAVLLERRQQIGDAQRKLQQQLAELQTEARSPIPLPATDALRLAIQSARKSGDLDGQIDQARQVCRQQQNDCETGLSRLTLWRGELAQLPGLALPDSENLDRFDTAFRQLDQQREQLQDKQEALQASLHQLHQQLDALQRAGAPPSEADLQQSRAQRDRLWQGLRQTWQDDNSPPKATDWQALEQRIRDSDTLVDRLRREAERVQQQASWQARRASEQQQLNTIRQQLQDLQTEDTRLHTDWRALWAPCQIEPRSPREMRSWLQQLEKVRSQTTDWRSHQQQLQHLEQQRASQVQLLRQALVELDQSVPADEALETYSLAGERAAEALDERRREQVRVHQTSAHLTQQLEAARTEQQALDSDWQDWQQQWRAAVADLRLADDASPSEINTALETLKTVFDKLREADKLRIRIHKIDEDAAVFADHARSVLTVTAPELSEQPVEEAVIRLQALLSEQHKQHTRREQLMEQQQQTEQDLQQSETRIQTLKQQLQQFCATACCESPAELEAVEQQSARYQQLETELAAIEQIILEAGDGNCLADLEAEARDLAPDTLPDAIAQLKTRIHNTLEPQAAALAEAKGRAQKELELMDGDDTAAELANQAQAVLAGIRNDAERYVQVKLASRVLRQQIERYRQEHQGPLVQHASKQFSRLTCQAFQGVRVDFNDRDEPVLTGIRTSDEVIPVEGMSSGTRDQLYLALRLASLESYLKTSGAMPFIVDDILVDFDDHRTEAALATLADLAHHTQVILFTHHAHVLELARASVPGTQIHRLG